ncbi:NAD(P)H-hydrate dehydratase [Sphingomonas crusticola]|uniref:NAD(P)H-hydrate dehydratase n=1 Tax=Sphingomonas crusticola TaxID=1697973 RepID=UPI000E23768D|nr:NAD(P)H-hydrate dehydratase [Sphingomonas crusticola]
MNRIDLTWRNANPLPASANGTDKNKRGRVFAVGGSRRVPGALGLTAQAVLRVGAGKVRMGTIEAAAIPLGLAMPEAGVIALPEGEDGELGPEAAPLINEQLETCDTFVFGPGMSGRSDVGALTKRVIDKPRAGLAILLDAAPLACAAGLETMIAAHDCRVVLTPHHGEMAYLSGTSEEAIAADPEKAAREAARRFRAIVVLKDARTIIASPDGETLVHDSDAPGLATGGSGDVLAGVIGGLLARGVAPLTAAGWGVWLHGAAGRAAAAEIGPTGFLARELLPHLPRLLIV